VQIFQDLPKTIRTLFEGKNKDKHSDLVLVVAKKISGQW
jgi:hypothetical protein